METAAQIIAYLLVFVIVTNIGLTIYWGELKSALKDKGWIFLNLIYLLIGIYMIIHFN